MCVTFGVLQRCNYLIIVQDEPKLLDDGGEIPKFQGRGWQLDSWM